MTAERQAAAGARASAPARAARAVVIVPLLVYRHVISPGLPPRCKYEPSCSRYAIDAIREYGLVRGIVLAAWRVLRCNPWSDGGYDPVHAQRVFKRAQGASA